MLKIIKKTSWINPVIVADNIANNPEFSENFIFLYSALDHEYQNSKSYISFGINKVIKSNNFDEMEGEIAANKKENYFGYLSYELKNTLEDFHDINYNYIQIPKLYFAKFNFNLEFDHNKQEIICTFPKILQEQFDNFIFNLNHKIDFKGKKLQTNNLENNFSDKEYLEKVFNIKKRIANGEIYQANLTRKFYGTCQKENYFDVFKNLINISPGNYSSFIKFSDLNIISSSPELFLDINKNKILSQPIKGTSPRSADKIIDRKNFKYLQDSGKEKAENLMIVDLVRNDLSRNCKINSVYAKDLFQILSFKKIHHMVSKIIGEKSPHKNNIDVIKGCFPPGSMTGAPKIKAILICEELEKMERGIYSGAIGLINYNICKLSVVIRTLIISDNKFEFQSGGAITFDSDPRKELQESKDKNKGISEIIE